VVLKAGRNAWPIQASRIVFSRSYRVGGQPEHDDAGCRRVRHRLPASAPASSALTPYLPPDLLPQVLAAAAIEDADARAAALTARAPCLAATPVSGDELFPALRTLTRRGRPALLADLAALAPWLVALAERYRQPETLAELARAVVEMGRWWP